MLPKTSSEKSSDDQKTKESHDKSKSNLDDIIIKGSGREIQDPSENKNDINLIVKKDKKRK